MWYGNLVTGALRAGTSAETPGTRDAAWGQRANAIERGTHRLKGFGTEPGSLVVVPDGR